MLRQGIFRRAVTECFSFLADHGFSLTREEETFVEYSSSLYVIDVYQGRRSREIDLEIQKVCPPPPGSPSPRSFPFRTVVAVFDGAAARTMNPVVSVDSEMEVKKRVHYLASTFQKYVSMHDLDSPQFWERLCKAREKAIDESSWPKAAPTELHKRFSLLWEAERFDELVDFFQPFLSNLTADELDKLDVARQILSRSDRVTKRLN
jgi:hypothetical protein